MKTILNFLFLIVTAASFSSCSLFQPKYGCPSNGKNVGAEKLLSGEKVPKAKPFRA